GGSEHHDIRDEEQPEHDPDHQVQVAETVVEEVAETLGRDVVETGDVYVGNRRNALLRRAVRAVDADEEVPRDPEREEVDRGAAHDLVGPQVNREEGVDERERAS